MTSKTIPTTAAAKKAAATKLPATLVSVTLATVPVADQGGVLYQSATLQGCIKSGGLVFESEKASASGGKWFILVSATGVIIEAHWSASGIPTTATLNGKDLFSNGKGAKPEKVVHGLGLRSDTSAWFIKTPGARKLVLTREWQF